MEDHKEPEIAPAAEVIDEQSAAANAAQSESMAVSKNQLKKLRKQERRLEIKKERKLKEKADNKARAEAQGRDLEAERKFLLERTAAGDRKRRLQSLWDHEKLPLACTRILSNMSRLLL